MEGQGFAEGGGWWRGRRVPHLEMTTYNNKHRISWIEGTFCIVVLPPSFPTPSISDRGRKSAWPKFPTWNGRMRAKALLARSVRL